MKATIYAQYPEDHDEQGVYLKAEGEAPPWQTETDCEEFDGYAATDEYPDYIHDLPSAQKYAKYLWGGEEVEVVSLEWWS